MVTMALSRVVSEIFDDEKCFDLEIGPKVTQSHSKWYLWPDFKVTTFFNSKYLRNDEI